MNLTKLEKECLRVALEYSICDYEENLKSIVSYGSSLVNAEEIKRQRQLVNGMQRVQTKLTNQLEKVA